MPRPGAIRWLFFGASALLVATWLLYFLWLHDHSFPSLVSVGWVALVCGLMLIFLAIRTLRVLGRPGAGQAFAHTTSLVVRGIYAVVRHPLYLGWVLIFFAVMFFSQHWLVLSLAALGSGCAYGMARLEDRELVERFGVAYERYMRAVPGMSLPAGALRLLKRRSADRAAAKAKEM